MRSPLFALAALGLVLGACDPGWSDAGAGQPASAAGAAEPGVGVCANPPLSPPTAGLCEVQPGAPDRLLLRGTLLLPERALENAQLLISGGTITCAGCDCSGKPGYTGATVVSCASGVISPGLINPHDHLGWTRSRPVRATARYDHRHEWRKGQNGKPKIPCWHVDFSSESIAWGEIRMILGGATSIMGEGSAKGLLRNLDWDNEGLDRPSVKNVTFPLGDSEGETLSAQCTYPSLPDVLTVQKAVAWVPHVAEGVNQVAQNEFSCLSDAGDGVDVTLSNTSLIHAVGVTTADGLRIAAAGTRVIWSPRSNISLYGHTADVVMLRNLGVVIALGTDWVVTGSMNMLRELACADLLARTYYGGAFDARDLWRMATVNAAVSAGIEDVVGQLAEGLAADVAVFDGSKRHAYAAVVRGEPADVALVLRGGKVLYGDAALVEALVPQGGQGCETLDVCQRSKRLCVERETGKTLAALEGGLAGETYPLFFCGTPDNEPTCVPSRPGEYDGQISATDGDGDGIADGEDSCPTVFNPPRPLDGGKQPDVDGDGVGDSCDPRPFDRDGD
jgi:hypothetical protein